MRFLPLKPHDEERTPAEKKQRYFKFATTTAVAMGLLGWTLASGININSGGAKEFGQGLIQSVACDQYITIIPETSMDTSNGTYYIDSITVGDISNNLTSNLISLNLFDSSGASVFDSPLETQYLIDRFGPRFQGSRVNSSSIDRSSIGGGTNQEVGTSSFTLTQFTGPNNNRIVASQDLTFTIETSGDGGCVPVVKDCTNGGTCGLGDTGPGGGPVVYIAATPFTEPVSGKKFKYIEAAPAFWHNQTWLEPRTANCNSLSVFSGVSLSRNIGSAVQNTNSLLANGSCVGTSTRVSTRPSGINTSAQLVRAYGSDWNLPTSQELVEMCKVARFGAILAATKSNCEGADGSTAPSGWGITNAGYVYWKYVSSSKGSLEGQIDVVDFSFTSNNLNDGSAPIDSSYLVRPIRYFG